MVVSLRDGEESVRGEEEKESLQSSRCCPGKNKTKKCYISYFLADLQISWKSEKSLKITPPLIESNCVSVHGNQDRWRPDIQTVLPYFQL